MRLAILILIHHYPEQAIKLINSLIADEDVDVFVHIDERSTEVFKQLTSKFASEKRVEFIKKRYRVYWGSFNQVRATLELMNIARKTGKYTYYSLLSGQDLLIKPIKEFKEFLSENKDKEFLHWYKLPHYENHGVNGGLDRVGLYWLNVKPGAKYFYAKSNDIIHKIQRALGLKRKTGLDLYAGAQWFTLSDVSVNYVIEFLRENPFYLKLFKFTSCSDELFFQTLLLNSPLKENIVNDSLRYIDWKSGPEYPKTMRMEDHANLINSGKFFARKFDEKVDAIIIEKLTAPFK